MELDYEPNYWYDLFSWRELERLINIRPLMSTDRVVPLSKKSVSWDNNTWVTNPNCFPSHIIKELIEEDVLYIKEMSHATKNINQLAGEIEKEYGYHTDAHIFICKNPSAPHPLGAHMDDNDNVIVQCEGETNWKVWDKVPFIPDDRKQWVNMDLDNPPVLDVTLLPGDAVWIPKFHPHLATSVTERLSVSFPSRGEKTDQFIDREWVII